MNIQDECLDYFKNPGLKRLIDAWIKKYQSLGYLGGTIQLNSLSKQEKEAMGLLLGIDLSAGILKITYKQFNKKLQETKFEGVDFLEVIKSLQSSPIYTNQEKRNFKNQKIENFKQQFLQKYDHTNAYFWLKDYLYKDSSSHKYIQNQTVYFQEVLENVCEALNHLPVFYHKYEFLSVFAQAITKDPHYFDSHLPKELLIKGIEYNFNNNKNPRTVEAINELLYQSGILKDDISNNCYICHIKPVKPISGWYGFYKYYEPWNMNLYNLMQVDCLFHCSCIYIVENPSVFRLLVNHIKEQQIDVGLICSNGQINLCTYMLLDKLQKSGCQLYYAGDYDPEGLLIADKLKKKYPQLHLWCYKTEYLDFIAKQQENISSKRIQLLQHIQNEKLQEIAHHILEISAFGYQEGLVSVYIKNMRI